MIENVSDNLFRIEVPLVKNPLRAINAYVVTSGHRNLLVDTGMNRPECRHALEAGLRELGVDRAKTDFFITHFHADHLGLVTALARKDSRVYFNEPEARWIGAFTAQSFLESLIKHAAASGFPEKRLENALKEHPGIKYSPREYPELTILSDGDIIEAGDYRFTCIHTPGHSPGHLCLHDPNKGIFISGDHVLEDITPNISAAMDDADMLGAYLESLDKVYDLDITLVLPGHRRTFSDCRARIRELKEHHQLREEEVLKILKTGTYTAYETAARMTWDFADSWEQFPMMQKWFAVGEAAAHLRHLEIRGRAHRELRNGIFVHGIA